MLDQRLVRDNPHLIAQELGRRGMEVDLTDLQSIAQQQKALEEQRSSLQADGNRIGKQVGQLIKEGADPKSSEISELRQQGNAIKHNVATVEEQEKEISARLREQL
ncbi:MAG: serine--tRNA ligase, partial [Prochlorococcus sp.]|nr:serine--tRNA ligase [Prochlorococcus sp.]